MGVVAKLPLERNFKLEHVKEVRASTTLSLCIRLCASKFYCLYAHCLFWFPMKGSCCRVGGQGSRWLSVASGVP